MRSWLILLVLLATALMASVHASVPAWSEDQGVVVDSPLSGPPAMDHPAEEAIEDNIGFPQLNASSYPSQIFWLGVAFVLLYTLMSRLALPRVTEVLEMRRLQRSDNLAKAGQLNEEADKIKTSYEKSLAKAQKAAAETLAAAEKVISEKISETQSRFSDNSR